LMSLTKLETVTDLQNANSPRPGLSGSVGKKQDSEG